MSRAQWKCPFTKILFYKLETKTIPIRIYTRSSIILPYLLNKTVEIYTGNKFLPILITSNMLYHKLGEFANTKAIFKYTTKNKKKN